MCCDGGSDGGGAGTTFPSLSLLAVDHLADAVNGAYDCAAQNGLMAEKGEDINEVIPANETAALAANFPMPILNIKKTLRHHMQNASTTVYNCCLEEVEAIVGAAGVASSFRWSH